MLLLFLLGGENVMLLASGSPISHRHMTPSRHPAPSLLPSNVEHTDEEEGGKKAYTLASPPFSIIKIQHANFLIHYF